MTHRAIVLLIQGLFLLGCLQSGSIALYAEEHCGTPVGTLVSVEGEVQIRRADQKTWLPATLDASFCAGDVLRVGTGGRAAVVLVNESILRVDQNTTLNFGEPARGSRCSSCSGACCTSSATARVPCRLPPHMLTVRSKGPNFWFRWMSSSR